MKSSSFIPSSIFIIDHSHSSCRFGLFDFLFSSRVVRQTNFISWSQSILDRKLSMTTDHPWPQTIFKHRSSFIFRYSTMPSRFSNIFFHLIMNVNVFKCQICMILSHLAFIKAFFACFFWFLRQPPLHFTSVHQPPNSFLRRNYFIWIGAWQW